MLLVHPNRPLPDLSYHAQAAAILQTFYPPPRLTSDSLDSPVSVIPESPPFTPAECDNPHAGTTTDSGPDTHDHDDIHTPTHEAVTTPQSLHPPPPPISSAPFTSHVTPSLTLLADRLDPSRVYSPVYQMRDLHVLERGCWVLRFALHSGVRILLKPLAVLYGIPPSSTVSGPFYPISLLRGVRDGGCGRIWTEIRILGLGLVPAISRDMRTDCFSKCIPGAKSCTISTSSCSWPVNAGFAG